MNLGVYDRKTRRRQQQRLWDETVKHRTVTKEQFDLWWTPEPYSGCWLWVGVLRGRGYGNYLRRYAHRVSWTIHNGEIPDGLLVCHKCDTPACVNPNHLFIGTHSDNLKDCFQKSRRSTKGECHPEHKLTLGQVKEIRHSPKLQRLLAAEFRISQSHVSEIKNGRKWKS